MRGRLSMLSYLSPSTGLLPAEEQGKPSFWDSLSPAEYGLFLPGAVYIPWEAAIRHAQKVDLWRYLSEAGPREGLVYGSDICIRCLSIWLRLSELPAAPLHHYAHAFPPTLGQSVHTSGKNPNSLEQGWPYAFPQSQWGCGCTLWTRLSTPIAILSGAIVFKSRT